MYILSAWKLEIRTHYRSGSYCCSNSPPRSVPVARVLHHDPCCGSCSTCVGVVPWEKDWS